MAVYSSRYARAFGQVVTVAQIDAAEAQRQLADFAATLEESRELREILMNPSIAQEQKLRILDAIAGRLLMFQQVRNFVAVIMVHQRLGDLGDILADYATIADEHSGLVEAEIVSAHPLIDEDRTLLEEQIARKSGNKVRTRYSNDPSLLGGVIVKIGSTVYDGSVKAQFAALKRTMSGM